MSKTLISAHRYGAAEVGKPSIIDCIQEIGTLGPDFIEIDVRITKDKKFVVYHDSRIEYRGRLKRISRVTLQQFLRVNPNSVQLDQALIAINKSGVVAHVDYKDSFYEKQLVDVCAEYVGVDGFMITTLIDKSVRRIRRYRPEVSVGLTLGADTTGLPKHAAFKIRISEYFPEFRIRRTKPHFLAVCYMEEVFGGFFQAKFDKLPILLWTLDTDVQISNALDNPFIWGIVTNRPTRALELREKPH